MTRIALSGMAGQFQSTPPRGGRPGMTKAWQAGELFQSTPPARGATGEDYNAAIAEIISIHAPREGGRRRPIHNRKG